MTRGILGALALTTVLFGTPVARAQAEWEDAPAEEAEAAAPAESAPADAPDAAPADQYDDQDPSALTEFRPELDPYGTWVEDPRYGTVWVPNRAAVGTDFAPYVTSGHWALTPEGDWTWVSDYPFGWVTFHYGRWVWTTSSGWVWVPGRQYAPAWVVWRVPDAEYGYVGWAPAPPTFVWWAGGPVALYYAPPAPYVFCHSSFVFSYRVHQHLIVDRARMVDVAHHTHRYVPSRGAVHRGPSMAAARVPAGRVPRTRVPANPRAVAASRPPAGYRSAAQRVRPAGSAAPKSASRPAARPGGAPAASRPAPRASGAPASRPSPAPRASGAPASRPSPAPRASGAPAYRPSGGRSYAPGAPGRVAPTPNRSYSRPNRAAPGRSSAPRAPARRSR